jgi:hypothetical protein
MAWRNFRATRWRTTELPTLFATISPAFGGAFSELLWRKSWKDLELIFLPLSAIAKSDFFLSLFAGGSIL